MNRGELPTELISDTKTKTVALSPELGVALPELGQSFTEVDQNFLDNPEEYLERLEASVFRFQSNGADIACSLLYGPGRRSDELLLLFAPFSDREPTSTGADMHRYITADSVSLLGKERAAPNTWNQITKSATVFELLKAVGKGMPVLTVFGPIPTGAFDADGRQMIAKGDFSPLAGIARTAVDQAQQRIHGRHSETRIDTLHFGGASLGASYAIGSAEAMQGSYDVGSVTAQELILGPQSWTDLGKRFMFSPHVGENSDIELPADTVRIPEVALRQAIDGHGSEIIGMNARMIRGMKPTYMTGLTKPEQTVRAVESLLDNNVALLVAVAENSALSYQTLAHLPEGLDAVRLRGEQGQKLGHIADEHVALSALVSVLGIRTPSA